MSLAVSRLPLASLLVLSGCAGPPSTPAVLVVKDPLEIPGGAGEREAETVQVDLTIREVIGELAPGVKTPVWTFNGTVPGPLIRVREGDTVELRVTNLLDNTEPHDVDLHVLEAPGGGAMTTGVIPGETRELSFQALHQGAFLYHCAAEGKPWEHLAHGMYGAILVEPPGGLEPVELEAYVAQSEWYLAPQAALAEGSEEEEGEEEHGGHESLPEDVWVMDEAAARRSEPTLFTFNGHRSALASKAIYGDRVHLPAGGRARLIFANAGPNLPSSLHVVGGVFDSVFTGPFTTALTSEETLAVPPGSAAVFELSLREPGEYELVDHALFHAERGALGLLHADAPEP